MLKLVLFDIFQIKSNYDVVYNLSSHKYEKYDSYKRTSHTPSTKKLWHYRNAPSIKNRWSRNESIKFNFNHYYQVKVNSIFVWSCQKITFSKLLAKDLSLWKSTAPHPKYLPLPPIHWYQNN